MNILIVEDDGEVAEFISIALEMAWPEARVLRTHLGKQAIKLAGRENLDLIILDLGLPDMDGYDVLKGFRAITTTPVIIATVRSSEPEIVKGLEFGADDYLVKPFGQLELVARSRALLRRSHEQTLYSPVVRGPVRLEPGRGELIYASKKIHVTRTEGLIIGLLLQNIGQLVAYEQIEEVLWGEHESCPSAADSIRVYISRLRSKINKTYVGGMVIRAHAGAGYTLSFD